MKLKKPKKKKRFLSVGGYLTTGVSIYEPLFLLAKEKAAKDRRSLSFYIGELLAKDLNFVQ